MGLPIQGVVDHQGDGRTAGGDADVIILGVAGQDLKRGGGRSNPTTSGGMQNGSSVGICTRCAHAFACFTSTCMLGRCLLARFVHRSSGGSLLKMCCWLEEGGLADADAHVVEVGALPALGELAVDDTGPVTAAEGPKHNPTPHRDKKKVMR